MAFLTEAELKTAQHTEVISAITRDDTTIIPIIIDEMISYMKGYLNARFDVDTEFDKTGTARHNVVLKILKDLVIYEAYSLHNPRMMTEVIQEKNTRAHKWLTEVQKGRINPVLAKPEDLAPVSNVRYGSNTKRSNHY